MITPFNNNQYKDLQKSAIYGRIKNYQKLYIEVGGKLFDDYHASRVLPGFDPNVKMQIFKEIKDDLEIIFCINGRDIITKKVRGDNNLTYADEVLRLCDCMNESELSVAGIMINFYEPVPAILSFEEKSKEKGIKTYHSYFIENYPNDLNKIASSEGFGKNDYIETHKKIVLVSAPGANSGKLETCLSQLYNDKVRGITSGYAKYETFPAWNLPVNHLVNVAYEMATADLCDRNMIDPFYKEACGKIAVNYNRDIESFPILSKILTQIYGKKVYSSPTNMGINNVGNAIANDYLVQKASYEEIQRRYEKIKQQHANHECSDKTLSRAEELYKLATNLFNNL